MIQTRRLALVLALLLVLSFSMTLFASAANGNISVYVTDTGEKYHTSGCQYLRRSSNKITLAEAIGNGYERCSKCSPPTMTQAEISQHNKVILDRTEEAVAEAVAKTEVDAAKQLEQLEKEMEKKNERSITIVISIAVAAVLVVSIIHWRRKD